MTEKTAFGVATLRALEGRMPPDQRLFDDPVAEGLLTGFPAFLVRTGPARRLFVRLMEWGAPGFFADVVCRTRAIDDACRSALAAGATQVAILGAGLDTRPYRLDEMRAVRVWELDLPAVQEYKIRILGDLPGHVRYVPVDLARQPIGEVLAANGFDAGVPSLIVFEAVSQYLPETTVKSIFAYAAELPAGSRIVFTYLPPSVLAREPRRARTLHWQTGFEPARVGEVLAAAGLTLLRDLGAAEFRAMLPPGRHLRVAEIDRVAVAAAFGQWNRPA
jgi:methyltransferase (TIGR00027 family)